MALVFKTCIRLKRDSKAVVSALFFSADVQYKQTKAEYVAILQCRTLNTLEYTCAMFSTYVVLSQIMHYSFALTGSDISVFCTASS